MVNDYSPFTYIDTHAAAGVYDLSSAEALRHRNFEHGLAELVQACRRSPAVQWPIAEYLNVQRRYNEVLADDEGLRHYLGSPALSQRWLRPQDRAMFFELSADVCEDLRRNVVVLDDHSLHAVDVLQQDSYAWLAGTPENHFSGRGLVLIDPPYDPYDEYTTWNLFIVRHLRRQWPASHVAVWYPCFDDTQVSTLHRRVQELRLGAVLVAELRRTRTTARHSGSGPMEGLRSSGLLLVNPPSGMADHLAEVLPALARMLAQDEKSGMEASVFWLPS